MRLGFLASVGKPSGRLPLAADLRSSTLTTVRRTAALPPPSLNGIAASNPRSIFNPLVLAYLGDAVWEAHSRRLEAYIEAWNTQQQQQQRGQGGAAVAQPGGDGTEANPGSRQERQAAVQQGLQQQRGAKGRARNGGRNCGRAKAGGAVIGGAFINVRSEGGSGLAWMSRQARKLWSTATFQALVFDALADGSLPVSQLGALPPDFGLCGLVAAPQEQAPRSTSAAVVAPPDSSTPLSTIAPQPTVPSPTSPMDSPAAAVGEESGASSQPVGLSPLCQPSRVQPGGAKTFTPQSLVLTAEELNVLRWGRNASVSSVPKDVPVGLYKKATAVEVLVRLVHKALGRP
ncbi:hypothetical protein Vretifemale_7992 [Volvox reticuliferus]|uniref:RNase III domain-containing protein n=1 Tax=Volvox reticuliferus TaxID=1737510 RepID=A0A8J4CA15_9CHLO|nr:hypothetical protein Vretifemale_7992 [Volvox reticuliferus]